MSYDLAVFDPKAELRDRARFEEWYDMRTEWEDDLDYNNPSNATPALQAWFHEMRQVFAPMNGPHSSDDVGMNDDELLADYSIANDLIYVTFSWGNAEAAYLKTKELAEGRGVGFLDASGDEGAAWFPGQGASLVVVHVAPQSDE
ncbi:hypothetical protein HZ992_15290 [Rhizobacter sp. AJA081-3]|uniref:hypothetical protein n=1 Tax=Rhizobacter sp. AJA081-3 TaxID=2753607 RepID=UPI001ADF008E|nr:hypothetical protein [Rhizobacter sp. AJA081-3]QTN21545.1 hypothetical protein HZ992_15290 [Rhizobacter sp. AJA081-3]